MSGIDDVARVGTNTVFR